MKYIFDVEPDDFILAGRAIKSHLQKWPELEACAYGYENEQVYWVVKNKSSYTVRRSE